MVEMVAMDKMEETVMTDIMVIMGRVVKVIMKIL
jgi:hypothetical protein